MSDVQSRTPEEPPAEGKPEDLPEEVFALDDLDGERPKALLVEEGESAVRLKLVPPPPPTTPVAKPARGEQAADRVLDRKGQLVRQKRQDRAEGKVRGMSNSAWERCFREALQMGERGDWTPAAPRHLVALYAIFHQQVYQVEALDLHPQARTRAAGAAKRLFEGHPFNGDIEKFVRFMRWAWKREDERERWRRASQKSGGRITWHRQFDGSLVVEWVTDSKRKAGI